MSNDDDKKVIAPTEVQEPKRRGLKPGQTNSTSFKAGPDARRQGGGRMSIPQLFKDRVRKEVLPEILEMALDKKVDAKTRLAAGIYCSDKVFGKSVQSHEVQGSAADALNAFAAAITARQLPSPEADGDIGDEEDLDEAFDDEGEDDE